MSENQWKGETMGYHNQDIMMKLKQARVIFLLWLVSWHDVRVLRLTATEATPAKLKTKPHETNDPVFKNVNYPYSLFTTTPTS